MPDFNFSEDIILEDERVLLRPIKAADFDALSLIASQNADLLQFSPKSIHTPELLKKYIEEAINDRTISFRYAFIVFDKKTQQYAGSTSFCAISSFDKRLEIGYTWYGKQFQRTGLNRHCKQLLLSYAFDSLQFERVELKTDERNNASRNAIQRLGAKEEGTLRSHTLMGDGFRRSTVYYGILKQEWEEIKNHFPLY